MRILALCPHVPFPPSHGGRIRSGVMLRALAGEHDVVVAAPISADERAAAERMVREFGVRFVELPAIEPRTSPWRKLVNWSRGRSDVLARRWSSAALRKARALQSAERPDVIVVDSTFAGPLLVEPPVAQVVVNAHNVESEMLGRLARGIVGRFEARLMTSYERRLFARARLVVAVSARDAAVVSGLAPSARVSVVENSVDTRALAPLGPPPADRPPALLFVGSFDYPPNREAAEILVRDHLPALRAACPELRVRLVGRDPTGTVEELVRGVSGADVAGFVDDLRAEYARASAVYLPLRSGGGTRLKVLEALALARPVIATSLAVEGLALERGRHWLGCDSPAEGAASLRIVLDGGATAMTAAGRAFVEQHHDDSIAAAAWREAIRAL